MKKKKKYVDKVANEVFNRLQKENPVSMKAGLVALCFSDGEEKKKIAKRFEMTVEELDEAKNKAKKVLTQ